MTDEITKYDDVIDLRDVIARVEELREARESMREEFDADPANNGVDYANWVRHQDAITSEECDELAVLESLLSECKGAGGDEQWEGDWYPGTLIRDSYFEDYAQELAEDIGAINPDASWPNNCIDWERAARELRMDYTSVEFDDVTYWTR